MKLAIVGAGIGGLTLGLELHGAGIACEIFEAAPEIQPVGVGINVLPHATKVLARLGLEPSWRRSASRRASRRSSTASANSSTADPPGRFAGYERPQFSIHRGDLQAVLLWRGERRARTAKGGSGSAWTRAVQEANGGTLDFAGPRRCGAAPGSGRRRCGLRRHPLRLRKQFFPAEGPPRYSGVNMWRGGRWTPVPVGGDHGPGRLACHRQAGDLPRSGTTSTPREPARQLVAEIETPYHQQRDWNRRAGWRISSTGLRTGISTGWTFPPYQFLGGNPGIPDGGPGPVGPLDPRHADPAGDAAHPWFRAAPTARASDP